MWLVGVCCLCCLFGVEGLWCYQTFDIIMSLPSRMLILHISYNSSRIVVVGSVSCISSQEGQKFDGFTWCGVAFSGSTVEVEFGQHIWLHSVHSEV